jgi:hypothetical protein
MQTSCFTMPVLFRRKSSTSATAGVALRLLNQAHLRGPVIIQFTLPNARKTVITAVAVPCWSHRTIVGMKFSGVDDDARHQYSDWLSDMALS